MERTYKAKEFEIYFPDLKILRSLLIFLVVTNQWGLIDNNFLNFLCFIKFVLFHLKTTLQYQTDLHVYFSSNSLFIKFKQRNHDWDGVKMSDLN